MNIPEIMHGTHEQNFGRRPESLTNFVTSVGYRAFDIYNLAKFGYDIAKANIARNEIFLQLKGRELCDSRENHYYTSGQIGQYSTATSLLNTDYIDAQFSGHTDWKGLDWLDLENLYRTEKVNYLGQEHVNELTKLKEIVSFAKIKPTFIQYGEGTAEYLRYCLENAIALQERLPKQKDTYKHITTSIAKNHEVTPTQVLSRFYVQMGIQTLSGGNSEAHVEENSRNNFELTPEEMKQLISAREESEAFLSIYEQLQDKTLMKLQDIISSYSNVCEEDLPALLNKSGHYMAKLDPTSLAVIIAAQDSFIIDYLKEYSADFSEITSNAYNKIIQSHGADFINLLREKLQVAPEKLLLASINSDYFSDLFKQSNLNELPKKDVLEIIKAYPAKLADFITANIAPETLLIAFSSFGDQQGFDAFLGKCDASKLSNLDLVKIITGLGKQAVQQLYDAGVNFSILTSNDLVTLIEAHGVEMARALANAASSAGLLIPAMKIGGIELFDELISQVNLSKFENLRLIKEMLEYNPDNLTKLLKNNISTSNLLYATNFDKNIAQSIFTILLTEDSLNQTYYTDFISYGMILLPYDSKNTYQYDVIFTKADISKLDSFDLRKLLAKAIDMHDIEWFDHISKALDMSKLETYRISDLLEKAIDMHDIKWFDHISKALDISKLGSSDLSKLLAKAIDMHDIEWFDHISKALDISKLDSFYLRNLLEKAIDMHDIKWFDHISKALNISKLDSSNLSKLLAKAIDMHDIEWFDHISKALDISKLDHYDLSYLLANALNKHGIDVFDKLLEAPHISSTINGYSFVCIRDAIELDDHELFSHALNKFGVNDMKAEHFAYVLEDRCLTHHLSEDKCVKIASEIAVLADINDRESALSNLFKCMNNEGCLEQCLTEDLANHFECYG